MSQLNPTTRQEWENELVSAKFATQIAVGSLRTAKEKQAQHRGRRCVGRNMKLRQEANNAVRRAEESLAHASTRAYEAEQVLSRTDLS